MGEAQRDAGVNEGAIRAERLAKARHHGFGNAVHNFRVGDVEYEGNGKFIAAQPCGKRILYAAQNAVLHALDADSGRVCTGFGQNGRIDLAALDYKGEGKPANTSPPAVWGNVVALGTAVQDNMYRNSLDGIVRAFDVVTGQPLWSWNPIPDDLSGVTGAANAWAPLSVDAGA